VAADAVLGLVGFTTIASAFQRTRLLMRRSISRLPGKGGCSSAEMVLMYGVLAVNGVFTPLRRAWSLSSRSSRLTRTGPPDLST
jgi:hypothetical protein